MTYIIPIGQECEISFLLQSCKLKHETQLFEWFLTEQFGDICKIINNISINKPITLCGKNNVYFENTKINSGHYTLNEFKPICYRRTNRLKKNILENNLILFVRLFTNTKIFDNDMIDNNLINNFINSINRINPNCNFKILILSKKDVYTIKHEKVIVYNHFKQDDFLNIIKENCENNMPLFSDKNNKFNATRVEAKKKGKLELDDTDL